MLSIATRKKFGRHCYADLCEELPICVAERYPTLRICGYMSARSASLRNKNSSAVPLLRSGHMSAICAVPSKGKGEIRKRVENRSFSKADFSQLREMFSIVKEMSFSASNSADNGRF